MTAITKVIQILQRFKFTCAVWPFVTCFSRLCLLLLVEAKDLDIYLPAELSTSSQIPALSVFVSFQQEGHGCLQQKVRRLLAEGKDTMEQQSFGGWDCMIQVLWASRRRGGWSLMTVDKCWSCC